MDRLNGILARSCWSQNDVAHSDRKTCYCGSLVEDRRVVRLDFDVGVDIHPTHFSRRYRKEDLSVGFQSSIGIIHVIPRGSRAAVSNREHIARRKEPNSVACIVPRGDIESTAHLSPGIGAKKTTWYAHVRKTPRRFPAHYWGNPDGLEWLSSSALVSDRNACPADAANEVALASIHATGFSGQAQHSGLLVWDHSSVAIVLAGIVVGSASDMKRRQWTICQQRIGDQRVKIGSLKGRQRPNFEVTSASALSVSSRSCEMSP